MTVPRELLDALESGTITQDQLQALITLEAQELGLSLEDALRLASEGTLPTGALGTDIEYLAGLLAA